MRTPNEGRRVVPHAMEEPCHTSQRARSSRFRLQRRSGPVPHAVVRRSATVGRRSGDGRTSVDAPSLLQARGAPQRQLAGAFSHSVFVEAHARQSMGSSWPVLQPVTGSSPLPRLMHFCGLPSVARRYCKLVPAAAHPTPGDHANQAAPHPFHGRGA